MYHLKQLSEALQIFSRGYLHLAVPEREIRDEFGSRVRLEVDSRPLNLTLMRWELGMGKLAHGNSFTVKVVCICSSAIVSNFC
jgi:hypothetical protein